MTDNSASDDELNCSRTIKRVMSVAGITGLGGGWLWTDQGNLAVAAALVTAALGLLVGRAELDGLTNLYGRAHRAAGRAHALTLTAARYRPDTRTTRAVALVALVALSVVGLQLAPVILLKSGISDQPAAGIAAAEEPREEIWQNSPYTEEVTKTLYIGQNGRDIVLIGSAGSNTIYAYEPETGNTKWTMDVSGTDGDIETLAYDAKRDNLLIGTLSSSGIESWDMQGNRNWRKNVGSNRVEAIHWSSETDKYYIADDADRARQIDPESQSIEWSVGLGSTGQSIDYDSRTNTVFAGDGSADVHAINATDGSEKWVQNVRGGGYNTRGIHSNGTHIFTITGGNAYMLEIPTGNVVDSASYDPNGEIGNRGNAYDADNGILYTARGGDTYNVRPVAINVKTFEVAWVGDALNHRKQTIATDVERIYLGDLYNGNGVVEAHGTAYKPRELLSGTVTDGNGNPVEGASVEATNTSTGETADSGTTDSSGAVELSVPPGDYNVTADGGTNYTAETKAVSVPKGGTSAEFSVRRAGEFGVYRISDGKDLDTDRPVTMEAYKASDYPEWYEQPAGFWDDKSAVYRTSGSTLQFQNLPDLDSEYIIRYVPDNRDKNAVYETDIVYWSNLSMVASMGLYADTETVDATVGIKDRTENQSWPPNSVTLEARNLQSDNTTDTTGLSPDTGLGELSIPPNKTSRIVAVRDDGTERHLGRVTNPVAATSDPVVFVIEDPWLADEDPRNQSAYDNTIALIEASPSGPTVGETVTLSAEGSTAAGANNEIDTVEWSLPDGTNPTGTEVTWTPESGDGDATHPISATVTDTNGNSDSTQVQLYVAEEGAPGSGQPTAYAEVVTDEPKPGEAVRIEDRSEPPANGEIDRIEWDTTGDGTYDDGQGPFVEETYSDPGVQQVSVRTVAQSGATDVYTTTIYVAAGSESQLNQPPVAEVVVDPRDPVVGDTVSFDASNSVGIGDATISSYEWKLPDGTTASGQTASYSPSEAGAGVVELTVTDSNGREASSQGSVYVAQNASARAVPPRADFAVKTEKPKVGNPVSLEATPELDDSASIESVKWDFDGDGDFSDADGESVEFTPEEAGITEVGVQVTDSNGAKSQFYEYFFVTGSASQLSVGGGGGGGAFGGGGDLGGEGPGGLPGGAPAVLGGTATLGLLVARRAGASVPTTAIGAAGAATTAALLAPDATAAAVESVPTAGWMLGGVAAIGVALQRAGVDVMGALSNLPIIGGRK